MWIFTALLLTAADPSVVTVPPSSSLPPPAAVAGNARRAGTVNFAVYSECSQHDARRVAELCERWRARLQNYWSGDAKAPAWMPRCTIVVHSNQQQYLAAVGQGAAQTLGTSWIEFDGAKVKSRRIDLLAEADQGLSALAHEMTHVIFADQFGGKQPPRWVDEGVAILADTPAKQQLHQRDLQAVLPSRGAFRCGELLSLDDYPAARRIPVFYGQSASLVSFLTRRDDPAKFVSFTKQAMDHGYDAALRDIYGIQGVAEMERLWQAQTSGPTAFNGVRLTMDARQRSTLAD